MKKITTVLFLFCHFASFSFQTELKETKYIYALDITLSMWGFGDNIDIFDEVRNELIHSIKSINNPSSEIVIFTFQDKIVNTWKVKANNEGKAFLIKKLENINKKKVPRQNTNIHNAWTNGKMLIDESKVNVFFLLTDGNHTVKHTSKTKLYNSVRDWNINLNNIYSFAFLVELTDKAKDIKLRKIIEKTKNSQIISGIRFSVLDIENKQPKVNINDDLTFNFNLIINSKHNFNSKIEFKITTRNEYFKIVNGNRVKFKNLPIKLKLKPTADINKIKTLLSENEFIHVQIDFDKELYSDTKLLMKDFKLNIINKKEKVLKIEVKH